MNEFDVIALRVRLMIQLVFIINRGVRARATIRWLRHKRRLRPVILRYVVFYHWLIFFVTKFQWFFAQASRSWVCDDCLTDVGRKCGGKRGNEQLYTIM